MSDTTARLALPMLVPGQAQKEMSHNEALTVIDAVVQASVAAFVTNTPPIDPVAGTCWIVGDAPSGAWMGHERSLAVSTAGGWRFVAPTPGFRVWVTASGADARFADGAWMLSTPAAPIDDPAGGATTDSQAREAIAAILEVLRGHNLLQSA